MIRRWFISYPRLIFVVAICLVCASVGVSLITYEYEGSSILVRSHLEVSCNWIEYIRNSVAHLYLQLLGWSGVGVLIILVMYAARLMQIINISYMQLICAAVLVHIHALWCAYIGYEPIAGILPGGWIGQAIYAWCVTICNAYDLHLEYVIRAALAGAGIATFRVRWIAYVTPVFAKIGTYIATGIGCILHTCKLRRKPHMFTPVVHEHIAREAGYETDEDQIFHDAFWSRVRQSKHENVSQDAYMQHTQVGHNQQRTGDACTHIMAETQNVQAEERAHQTFHNQRSPDIAKPDTHLLSYGKPRSSEPDTVAQQQARRLEEKLATFGITGYVTHITCGPVVTLFSYQPDKAVKIANITAREDDLRLALEAVSLRIIAPIPGTSVVGFEVSRPHPEAVTLRRLLENDMFWHQSTKLPLALGTDTAGNPFIADLADMPHLLVAGSTGSGKSVALHSFLISLLYRCHPDATKLVLIDPKRLEFVAYQDMPHLASPVITQSRSVVKTFEWLVREMEQRYDTMAQAGVRNITEYHSRYGEYAMPYIVVVVDELADLMMGVGKDIEQYIARLAQMARAAGIHLIVATQRPSVDVVTGMIKVNFLSRIAFKVTSKIDSRTIVDQPGAEKLLGRGDMLFLDSRGVLHRLHGGYIQQEEIEAVIRHWSGQPYEHVYLFDPAHHEQSSGSDEQDDLYDDVMAYVQSCDTISISLIQRRFRIGYNRSARLVEMLEHNGVVSPADSNKMRRVLQ